MSSAMLRWRIQSVLIILLVCASCASGSKRTEQVRLRGAQARSVAVAPFNVVSSLPVELDDSVDLVSRVLVSYLESHGKEVSLIDFREGQQLWLASVQEINRSGGEKSFEAAARVFAVRIAARGGYDAIIIPTLFVQLATIASTHARWDGVRHPVEYEGPSSKRAGAVDEIQAASVFLQVVGADGELIHSKQTGLELIEHVVFEKEETEGGFVIIRTYDTVADTPAIESEALVRQGLALALDPFVPKADDAASDPAVIGPIGSDGARRIDP